MVVSKTRWPLTKVSASRWLGVMVTMPSVCARTQCRGNSIGPGGSSMHWPIVWREE